MSTLLVVFDTNLYRKLGADVFDELRDRERNLSIQAAGSYYVAMELLAHLADDQDPQFAISHNSLRRLWQHTKTYDGSRYVTNLMEPAESQVSHVLFRAGPKDPRDDSASLGGFVGQIANTERADLPGRFEEPLCECRDLVQSREEQFTQSLFDRVVRTLVPEATDWFSVTQDSPIRSTLLESISAGDGLSRIAEGTVRRIADDLGIELSQEELAEKVAVVKQAFPVPIHLFNGLVRNIVENGLDMTKQKRANSLWDFHIAFSTGTGANLDGMPIWLVTNDGEILKAAATAGATQNVKPFDEYTRILDLKWESFRELLDHGEPRNEGDIA